MTETKLSVRPRWLQGASYVLLFGSFTALIVVALPRLSATTGGGKRAPSTTNAVLADNLPGEIEKVSRPDVPQGVNALDLDGGDDSLVGQLVFAAAADDLGKVRELLVSGGGADDRDAHGYRPLDGAAAACSVDIVDVLLESGADPNATSRGDWTPLVWASYMACPRVVRRLVESGADPDGPMELSPESAAATPLEMLTTGWYRPGLGPGGLPPLKRAERLEILRVLLQANADPNRAARNLPLSTLVNVYATSQDSEGAELLLEHGADPKLIPQYTQVRQLPGAFGDLLRRAAGETAQ